MYGPMEAQGWVSVNHKCTCYIHCLIYGNRLYHNHNICSRNIRISYWYYYHEKCLVHIEVDNGNVHIIVSKLNYWEALTHQGCCWEDTWKTMVCVNFNLNNSVSLWSWDVYWKRTIAWSQISTRIRLIIMMESYIQILYTKNQHGQYS